MCYISVMRNHTKRLQKHHAANSWLRNYLMTLQPGSRLPGIREMMRLSGVGRTVLEKALHQAEKENLLIRKERVGFFRSALPATAVDVIVAADNSNLQLDPVGSCRTPSYAARIAMQLLELSAANDLQSCFVTDLEQLPPGIRRFVICPDRRDVIERIEQNARTVVISGCGGKLWVKPPGSSNIAGGLEYLYNLGHRKIGFFYRTPSKMPGTYLFAYYKFMAEHGVKVFEHFLIDYTPDADDDKTIAVKFRAALREQPRIDSAVVPACWLPTVYEVLRQEKLLIPWHISILSLGHPPEDTLLEPSPAVLADNPVKLSERAWEIMFSDAEEIQEQLPVEISGSSSIMRR